MSRSRALVHLLLLATIANVCGEPLPDSPPTLILSTGSEPLPGTERLTHKGDLSRELVDANGRFLDLQLIETRKRREAAAGKQNPDELRASFRKKIGYDAIFSAPLDSAKLYDEEKKGLLFIDEREHPLGSFALGGEAGLVKIHRVEWEVREGITGKGFLVEPTNFWTQVIAIPNTSQEPLELFHPGSLSAAYALKLAMGGARVLVPTRIRRFESNYTLTDREWLARPAYELGTTLIGYELHKLAALQVAAQANPTDTRFAKDLNEPMGWNIIGWGDGGMLALYASAMLTDTPFQTTGVSGYFGNRDSVWAEPFDHQIFGLLKDCGDADIASLISPRQLIIESGPQPDYHYRTKENSRELDFQTAYTKLKGKPGRLSQSSRKEIEAELQLLNEVLGDEAYSKVESAYIEAPPLAEETIVQFLRHAGWQGIKASDINLTESFAKMLKSPSAKDRINLTKAPPENKRLKSWNISEISRTIEREEIERHIQARLVKASATRTDYFKELNTKSLESFEQTIEPYREKFRTEVIGDFEIPLEEPKPRTRPYQETETTISYEVVLDVFEEVFAYGILTLPKSLPLDGSEKRPVIVCQHGLEGTPQDLIGEQKFKAYKAFATSLAERGFITFAPQNGYKYFDHFRMQQFKAQSMGKTLFSLIVPQHQQITKWLSDQPFVDGEKIGFYGLSYGGKAAMRIPPLVDRYCLSICAGDFNEWVWKNAATDKASLRYSYANKGEYEIFEWNLGGTFNYAEMAALICPRPFMVERGHFDGVAPDEKVGYEFAKVRRLYAAKLGIGERCEIEWFPGPHCINGAATIDFLHKHLEWEKP